MRIFSTPATLSLVALFASTAALAAPGGREACLKLEWASVPNCENLKVLATHRSGCSGTLGPVELNCRGADRVRVVVPTEDGVYRSTLRRRTIAAAGGAWGGTTETTYEWSQVGAIAWEPVGARAAAPAPSPPTAAPSLVRTPPPHPVNLPPVVATTPVAEAPAPTFAPTISLLFDAYWSLNFANPPYAARTTMALPAAVNDRRFYDAANRRFVLNLAELSFKGGGDNVSYVVDVDFGEMAELNHAGLFESDAGLSVSRADEITKHLGQAVLSFAPFADSRWSFDLGKMPTHVGFEVIKARDNWNYSRSMLFSWAIPVWHLGARAGYTIVPSALSASLYVYDGWNTFHKANALPSLGAQLKWTPSGAWTLVYNFLGGAEGPDSRASALKTLHNVNVLWAANDRLSFGYDSVYGRDDANGGARWMAVELLAKLTIGESWWLSPRVEAYVDQDGLTMGSGAKETLYSATLTAGFALAKGLELRAETRLDASSRDRFPTKAAPSSKQGTLLAGFLYSL